MNYIKLLKKIEKTDVVNQFNIRNFNYWPILRISIGSQLNVRNRPSDKIKRRTTSIVKQIFLFFKQIKNIRLNPSFVFITLNSGRQKVGTTYLDPYGDAFFETMEKGYSNSFIIDRDKKNEGNPAGIYPSVYFPYRLLINIYRIHYFICRGLTKKLKRKIKELKTKFTELREIDERAVIINVHAVIVFSIVYKLIFRIIKPKKVVLNCFYSSDSFGIVKACNELGIKVYDYQHGVQGRGHYAYSEWFTGGKRLKLLLPTGFLVWDKISEDYLNSWVKEEYDVILVGNGLTKLSKKLKTFESTYIQQLEKKMPNNSCILFTFQDVLPQEWLFNVIRKNNNIFWILRLHPQYKNLSKIIESRLGVNTNWDLKINENINIMSLIDIALFHVTVDSSVVLQAYELNKPSIVIGGKADEYYSQLIDEGFVFNTPNEESFQKKLLELYYQDS